MHRQDCLCYTGLPGRYHSSRMHRIALALLLTGVSMTIAAQAATPLDRRIEEAAARIEQKVIADRRDIHQNPELGNREFRTAKLIEKRLRDLGIEVKTGVAHTGAVGLLRGGKPGRIVALRADMEAIPV